MKNIFNKLGLLLMTLVMGVSYANADEVNNPVTLTVDPVSTMPGNIIDVPIMYESTEEQNTFQMDIVLPKGLTFELTDGKYGTVGDAIPQGCLYEEKFKDNREDGLDAVRVVCVSMVTPFKKGQLLTFKVKATDELADVTQIKLEKIKFSKIYFTYTIDVKNIKKEWDANEAANTKINEALTALMTALDAADAKINETCVESVKTVYLDKLGDCVTNINKQAMELNAKYAAIQLTEKDAEDFVADCAKAQAQFDVIVAESAAAMTKKFEANEAANATFQAAFTEISTLLNDADAKINDECPDVKETYLDQLAEIATQVNQKGMELGSLYAAIELTQEVADKAAAEINAFAAQIKDIVAAAVKAQNEIATGIHGINADFQNAEAVYSIGGVRLNKAAKGVNVVIRNGKAIKVVK
jgi:hypothetical protein